MAASDPVLRENKKGRCECIKNAFKHLVKIQEIADRFEANRSPVFREIPPFFVPHKYPTCQNSNYQLVKMDVTGRKKGVIALGGSHVGDKTVFVISMSNSSRK